jgi:putative tricarboxylic transport membrane protein
MRKAYLIANLVWIALAVAVCVESVRLKVGSLRAPGPAFLPFFAAVLLGILSLISLIQTWREKEESGAGVWSGTPLVKIGLLVGVLFLYTAVLKVLGFLLATFLLLLFLFRVVEPLRWKTILLVTAVTMGGIYLLFGVLIESSLPKGFLGF